MSETFTRYGHPNPKLIIWIEAEKASPRGEALLYWHLKRLNLESQEVAVDYDVNAPIIKSTMTAELKTGVIIKDIKVRRYLPTGYVHVVAGKTICKLLTDASFVTYKWCKLLGRPIWLCHGFEYNLATPALSYEINRLLFLAAQSAGLKPEVNLTIPMFQNFITR